IMKVQGEITEQDHKLTTNESSYDKLRQKFLSEIFSSEAFKDSLRQEIDMALRDAVLNMNKTFTIDLADVVITRQDNVYPDLIRDIQQDYKVIKNVNRIEDETGREDRKNGTRLKFNLR
ncbi:MAG: hypothetical protein ACQEQL_06830, partial [Pseudomonadota bacterium]